MGGQWWDMTGSGSADPARRARFGEVFALVYEPLQRYVRRRGGGSDADDIVAETLTVLWRRLDDDLDQAMAQLDPDQRELLHLWAWEGFAPREIAVVQGITANAASIRLHRARRELAELLGPRKTAAASGHMGTRTTKEHR